MPYRPGDVLRTRKGLTVEIGNTDAEGRLVLGDALARGRRGRPDLLIDLATLTGAARVALGPELPAVFGSRPETVDALLRARARAWRIRCGRCRSGTATTTRSPAGSRT